MGTAPAEEMQLQTEQTEIMQPEEETALAPETGRRPLPLVSTLDEADKLPISLGLVLHLASQLDRWEQRMLMRRLREMQQPKANPLEALEVFDVGPWPEGLTLSRADYYPDEDE